MKKEDMTLKKIIECIMTQHWDMKACHCWVCREGRKNGCAPKQKYLNIGLPTVTVENE